jgi:DNA-3-methyladenine glycosylase II
MEHITAAAGCTAEVELAGPYDFPATVSGFGRRGDDLLDRWDGAVLRRVVATRQGAVAVACENLGTTDAPRLRVIVDDSAHLAGAVTALLATLIQAPAAFDALRASDPVIERLERLYPGVRPVLQTDLFESLVRAISAQQVNLRWAATTRSRLALAYGERHEVAGGEVWRLDPARLSEVDPAELRALQFTTRKSEYIVGAAREVTSGGLDLEALRRMDDEEVIARVTRLRGQGRWSAEWLLARTLGRPRVVAGDLGVRKAVWAAYGSGGGGGGARELPGEDEVRRLTAHWGEAAGIAQQLLLHGLIEGALGGL